jgi:hypothetical protein
MDYFISELRKEKPTKPPKSWRREHPHYVTHEANYPWGWAEVSFVCKDTGHTYRAVNSE